MTRPSQNGPYESLYGEWDDDGPRHRSIISSGHTVSCWLDQQVRLQTAAGESLNSQAIDLCSMSLAGDDEFCRYAVELIARDGTKSADVDVRLLGDSERWKLAKACSHSIRHGAITPVPPELHAIPKTSGPGERTIALYMLHDRVIQKVLAQIAACIIDDQLPEELIGSRRGRNRLLLVERLCEAVSLGKTYILKADLRNAFDNVPVSRLSQVLACWLPPRLCELSLMSLHPGLTKRGIPQGHCVSPRLLNVYVAQTILPKLRAEFPDVSLTMYVDDLIAAGESREQMLAMGNRLDALVKSAGFSLKAAVEDSVFDLAAESEPVVALGFGFSAADGLLDTTIADSGWDHLAEHLIELHSDVDAPIRASGVIHNWLTQNSPCLNLDRKDKHVRTITRQLRRCELREWPDHSQVSRLYDDALNHGTVDELTESPPCAVQTIEPCFPPKAVELEELAREPEFFVYVHAWYPRKRPPEYRGCPRRGGWAWVITNSDHTIVAHGRGAREVSFRDLLMLEALEETADRWPDIVPEGGRGELVMDSQEYRRWTQRSRRSSVRFTPLETPTSFNQRWRYAAQRLYTRDLTIEIVTRKNLELLDSSDRGRMVKAVRFWAEQVTVDADSFCNTTVPA